MDALRNVYKNSQTSDFKRTVRELKNKVYAYTEMEQVRSHGFITRPAN